MTGTLINVAAILAGTLIGVLAGARLPEGLQRRVLAGLGLVTLVIGVDLALAWRDTSALYVLGAVLLGGLAGEALGIEARLARLGDMIQRRVSTAGDDGFASIALAATLGWGVALAALSVLIYQGTLSLGSTLFEDALQGEALAALTSAGGLLIIGISLKLLDLKDVKVGNFLPALVVAPALVGLVSLVR